MQLFMVALNNNNCHLLRN